MEGAPPHMLTGNSGEQLLSASKLLASILDSLRRQAIPYVVERNYTGYPEYLTGDVDLIVAPAGVESAAGRILQVADELGWSCFYELRRPYVRYLGLCRDVFPERSVLVIELFAGGLWYSVPFLTAAEILAQRRLYHDLWVPSLHHEAGITLFHHLLWNRRIPQKYRTRIGDLVGPERSEFLLAMTPAFGERLSKKVCALVQDECWAELEGLARQCLLQLNWRGFSRRPFAYISGWCEAVRSWQHTEQGVVLVLRADHDVWRRKVVQAMLDLADEWHIFLPSFRKCIDVATQAEFQQQRASLFRIARRAVARGGVAVFGVPLAEAEDVFSQVGTCYRIDYRHNALRLQDRLVAEELLNHDHMSARRTASLIWSSVLASHANRRAESLVSE